ncbi:hypothetical protein [Aeromonas sp. sif2433]|uniref:hypothetical protein n=1 Tax=Aeromonas sp. sif2433 TaxID=2854794 RepID=UPI001C44AB90|nr:hypothetical protein [Aeromonas sp. sif2433]MBV7416095.1 hypothetical protein [Aeromonas sp. sif2433]
MSPANHVPLVKNSNLEAEIQCGSHAGVCHGQRHTAFLCSRNGCAKKEELKQIQSASDVGR